MIHNHIPNRLMRIKAGIRSLRYVLWLLLAMSVWTSPARAAGQPDAPSEYQVKAAFLYNFANFVDWPDAVFADNDQAIVIGILGEDPFGPDLDAIIKGRKIGNRPLRVQREEYIEDLLDTQILFLSQSEEDYLSEILDELGERPILTVSDIKDAASQGVMIGFVSEGNRVVFEMNLDAAEQADLRISSRLLKLAKIVGGLS